MLDSRPVVREILIGAFVTLTTPVTLMLLVRAVLRRDRPERRKDVQPAGAVEDLGRRAEHSRADGEGQTCLAAPFGP